MAERHPKPVVVIDGTPWWDYLYDYDMDGATYTFRVRATSEADASARMRKMALARYVGQADGEPITLHRGGIFAPLVVWWRNFNLSGR